MTFALGAGVAAGLMHPEHVKPHVHHATRVYHGAKEYVSKAGKLFVRFSIVVCCVLLLSSLHCVPGFLWILGEDA